MAMRPSARVTAAALAVLGGGVAACAYYASYAVRSQWLGPTIWRGNPTRPLVALTFDDGPSEDTPRILDVLEESGVRAAFFMIGRQVARYPELARRIVAGGHEVGNHSYSHPIFLYRTARQTRDELARTQEIIADVTSARPVWSRPPCGVRSRKYFAAAHELGLRTVQWTVAGFDWKRHASSRIAADVLSGVGAGAIVLLHDGDSRGLARRRETAASLPLILEGLRAKELRACALTALVDPQSVNSLVPGRLHV
jgi:peptidoglycan/xylan/chitin deacetylase (PgdA/CDA1 family)